MRLQLPGGPSLRVRAVLSLCAWLLVALPMARALPAPAQEASAPTEKQLLAQFDQAFSPSDAAARTAAITSLGDGSRALPDGGASKLMARTLGKGLLDEDLEVRAAALAQFTWGRHVESSIEFLRDSLADLLAEVEKRLTRPDDESRLYVARGTRLFGDGCTALANYRDDRSVEALIPLLRGLQKNGAEGDNLSTRAVGPLATAVLALGTREAVEAAVKQTQVYTGPGGRQAGPALLLHRALAEFATQQGVAPPDFSDNVAVDWHEWFQKTQDRFPAELGRLKVPPSSPPAMGMKDRRGRKDDGSAPRR